MRSIGIWFVREYLFVFYVEHNNKIERGLGTWRVIRDWSWLSTLRRCRFTYLKIRSISHRPSISAKNRSKSTVDVDSYQKKIGRYWPSMCPHSKKKSVDGRYRPSKWTWTQKIVNIDLTHPYFITKRCIWLTRTLTSAHPDPFQALLTKQHTTKKPTHTEPSPMISYGDCQVRIHLAFWVPLLTCASSCDASNAWPLGPAAFFREVRTIDLWSHMVP